MNWEQASDVTTLVKHIVDTLNFSHIDTKRIICFRSYGSSSRATARIWSFPRVWQQALNLPAHYVIEVLSKRFDRLSDDDKKKTIIHELLHIPKNFSGALRPHNQRGWVLHNEVSIFYKQYKTLTQR